MKAMTDFIREKSLSFEGKWGEPPQYAVVSADQHRLLVEEWVDGGDFDEPMIASIVMKAVWGSYPLTILIAVDSDEMLYPDDSMEMN